MAGDPLDAYDSVVLDGSGDGSVTFQPDSFRTWTVTGINVETDQAPTATPVPRCRALLAGRLIAQTWMGNGSTASGSPETVQPSQQLTVEWTGGVPGSRATVYLSGTMNMR